MKRKTKEKVWSLLIALIFLTSMVMFGLTFNNGSSNQKSLKLENLYNRELNRNEYNAALNQYKTIIEFYHPNNCCQNTISFFKELPGYSSGNVIYCDIESNNTSVKMESLNGAITITNRTDIENNTILLKDLCNIILFEDKIPECVLIK